MTKTTKRMTAKAAQEAIAAILGQLHPGVDIDGVCDKACRVVERGRSVEAVKAHWAELNEERAEAGQPAATWEELFQDAREVGEWEGATPPEEGPREE